MLEPFALRAVYDADMNRKLYAAALLPAHEWLAWLPHIDAS